MPFGKYRGLEVESLPGDYLEWLLTNVDLRLRLRLAVCDELDRRYYEQETRRGYEQKETRQSPATVAIQIPKAEIQLARELFDCGYRAAARAHHPDVGGNSQTMVRLNALVGSLRSQLQAVEGMR